MYYLSAWLLITVMLPNSKFRSKNKCSEPSAIEECLFHCGAGGGRGKKEKALVSLLSFNIWSPLSKWTLAIRILFAPVYVTYQMITTGTQKGSS